MGHTTACGRDARAPRRPRSRDGSHHCLWARRPRTQALALPRWVIPLPAGETSAHPGACAPAMGHTTACGRDVCVPRRLRSRDRPHHCLRARRPRTQAPALPRWVIPLPTGETSAHPGVRAPAMGHTTACGRDARAPRRPCRDAHRSRKPGTSRNAHWTGPDTHASPRSRPGILSAIGYRLSLARMHLPDYDAVSAITTR